MGCGASKEANPNKVMPSSGARQEMSQKSLQAVPPVISATGQEPSAGTGNAAATSSHSIPQPKQGWTEPAEPTNIAAKSLQQLQKSSEQLAAKNSNNRLPEEHAAKAFPYEIPVDDGLHLPSLTGANDSNGGQAQQLGADLDAVLGEGKGNTIKKRRSKKPTLSSASRPTTRGNDDDPEQLKRTLAEKERLAAEKREAEIAKLQDKLARAQQHAEKVQARKKQLEEEGGDANGSIEFGGENDEVPPSQRSQSKDGLSANAAGSSNKLAGSSNKLADSSNKLAGSSNKLAGSSNKLGSVNKLGSSSNKLASNQDLDRKPLLSGSAGSHRDQSTSSRAGSAQP